MTGRRFALVTGGGTAGHTVPALAVARALLVGRPAGSVELVGSKRGLDAKLLSGVELPVTLLGGRGFRRSRSGSATFSNMLAFFGLASAFVASLVVVARRRPSVVVAVGGYASVAPTVAAAVFGVPVIVLNVDAVPGAANRMLAKIARAAAVAYPGTAMKRAVVTGAPVRPEVVAVAGERDRDPSGTRSAARRHLGLPWDARVVAAFGGSLGAMRLNEAVLGLVARWSGRGDVAIYHVVGTRNAEWAAAAAGELMSAEPGGISYVQVPYEDHMELVYAAADIAVCRAGANTVAELTVTGTPSILVPLPGAPGDHQTANARVLESRGAGIVIQDDALDTERLADELDRLLGDHDRLERMSGAARGLGRPDAADAVAALAVQHARWPHSSHCSNRPRGPRASGVPGARDDHEQARTGGRVP
ncbi:MAG: UDP-N-acetylglucosamine--N-acetylmuramyl-(pentapeptide) pyrophosphoryl-undecaprenol N-acetylglucosamine transferase [Acidimicrobiales bacterium]